MLLTFTVLKLLATSQQRGDLVMLAINVVNLTVSSTISLQPTVLDWLSNVLFSIISRIKPKTSVTLSVSIDVNSSITLFFDSLLEQNGLYRVFKLPFTKSFVNLKSEIRI